MTLAVTNISTAVAKAAISESTNEVKDLCISGNINEWSLHKPANYGAGNDAWTPDINSPTGFKNPLNRATDANGFRLGDFRGYNHDANPPRYFLDPTEVEVPKYEPFEADLDLLKGEMSETSTADGFGTFYWVKFDGSNNALLGVKLNIDSAGYGDVIDITESSTMLMPISNLDSGSHTLRARYFDRGVYTEPWDFRNLIEGGDVTLNINTTAALFEITNIDLTPESEGPKAPQEDISVDYTATLTFHNSSGSGYVRAMYWTFEDSGQNVLESGTFNLTLLVGQTKSLDVDFSHTFSEIGTYTFNTRVFSTSGEIVDGGTDTTIIFEA